MNESFLLQHRPFIQNILDDATLLTHFEFDLNDNHAVRIAGTERFKSITFQNNETHSNILSQVKKKEKSIYISSRTSPICQRCTSNRICSCTLEFVVPLFIAKKYAGSLSALCYTEELAEHVRQEPSYYQSIVEHIASFIEFIGESILLQNSEQSLLDNFQYYSQLSSDCIILLKGKRISYMNQAAATELFRHGLTRNTLNRCPVNILASLNGPKITLKVNEQTVHLNGMLHHASSNLLRKYKTDLLMFHPDSTPNFSGVQEIFPYITLDHYRGFSSKFRITKEKAIRIATHSQHFLVQGEHGIGKISWVRALNNQMPTPTSEFIVYNSTAFSDVSYTRFLFDDDTNLFSHMNSTVCLKEIVSLPLWVQKQIVNNRALIEQNNIRITATMSEPLSQLKISPFLLPEFMDLFAGSIISIPPLRERGCDIVFHIHDFLKHLGNREKKEISCSPDALKLLSDYSWPQNFMQMERYLSFLVSNSETGYVTCEDVRKLPGLEFSNSVFDLSLLEKETIQKALLSYSGEDCKRKAAKALGISKATLYRKIEKYGL